MSNEAEILTERQDDRMDRMEEAWNRDAQVRAQLRKERIQRGASFVQRTAVVLFLLSVVAMIGAAANEANAAWLWEACGGLFGVGLMLTLIAQVMYCRAALEARIGH